MFAGHGSPMNALADNGFTRALQTEAAALAPRPRAVLCISAHWQSVGSRVTTAARPETIHDFYGFPPELSAVQYPAPGSPELANEVIELFDFGVVDGDAGWGLDHGAWSVLRHMFPAAGVPVVQLSLDRDLDTRGHIEIARRLAPLRERGVLILGSGNIVHNLRRIDWRDDAEPYAWAIEFDGAIGELLLKADLEGLAGYRERCGETARLAVPTDEHYLPLLYAAALREPGEPLTFFYEGIEYGSISMRSLRIG